MPIYELSPRHAQPASEPLLGDRDRDGDDDDGGGVYRWGFADSIRV